MAKSQSIRRECLTCGAPFVAYASHIARGQGVYCSMKCRRRRSPPIRERFWAKVQRNGETECWPWSGSKKGPGYGSFGMDGRTWIASRVAWVFTFGQIPKGMDVLHRCDNPPCVNPAHLFLGTDIENTADKLAKGRHRLPKSQPVAEP